MHKFTPKELLESRFTRKNPHYVFNEKFGIFNSKLPLPLMDTNETLHPFVQFLLNCSLDEEKTSAWCEYLRDNIEYSTSDLDGCTDLIQIMSSPKNLFDIAADRILKNRANILVEFRQLCDRIFMQDNQEQIIKERIGIIKMVSSLDNGKEQELIRENIFDWNQEKELDEEMIVIGNNNYVKISKFNLDDCKNETEIKNLFFSVMKHYFEKTPKQRPRNIFLFIMNHEKVYIAHLTMEKNRVISVIDIYCTNLDTLEGLCRLFCFLLILFNNQKARQQVNTGINFGCAHITLLLNRDLIEQSQKKIVKQDKTTRKVTKQLKHLAISKD